MSGFDLAGHLVKWKSGYEKLFAISKEQLVLIKTAENDEHLWDKLRQLAEERKAIQTHIENVQKDIEAHIGQDEMKSVFQRDIQSLADSARVLTFEAAYKIEVMMISIGSELQTAKTQRRLFDAYSGMNSDDQISYYFDERK